VLSRLLEDEVVNNLPISILTDNTPRDTSGWFMCTVTEECGKIVLVALCVKPFNLTLYQPPDSCSDSSVYLLSDELKRINFTPSGVFAVTALARTFANAFFGNTENMFKMSMLLMRLDKLSQYEEAPGFCRYLTEDDLTYTPLWEQAFCIDCRLPAFSLSENEERIRTRIDRGSHFIWEDGLPVAQAVYGRDTPNGAVINWVYTPPLYRGKGYATSVVAWLSQSLFDRGKSFCCLFADADNPASCRVYHKLGYYDICEFEQIQIEIGGT
jgi:hypothetical protein